MKDYRSLLFLRRISCQSNVIYCLTIFYVSPWSSRKISIARHLLPSQISWIAFPFFCALHKNKQNKQQTNTVLAIERNKISLDLSEQDVIKMRIFSYNCIEGFSTRFLVSPRIPLSLTAIHLFQVQIAHSLQCDLVRN